MRNLLICPSFRWRGSLVRAARGFATAVLVSALLLTLAGCATGPRSAAPVAPEPEVPAATWALVEQDIRLAAMAARADAAAYARAAMEQWLGRVEQLTEKAFVPWYTSYWTQEWLAVKLAFSRSNDDEGDAAALRRLAGYLQEQYVSKVLEPASDEIDPSGVLHRATAIYVQDLGQRIEAIGSRYGLPERAFRDRLDAIPAISVGGALGQGASLGELIQPHDSNGPLPYAALMAQVETAGVDVHSQPSEGRLSPIASAVAETFVRKIAARGGAAAAAAAVGGPAGIAVSLGITGLGLAAHNRHKTGLEAQLRVVLAPALEQMRRDLLQDPQYGVLGVVNHINGQIQGALRASRKRTQWPRLEGPSDEPW